jgi:hypothetical protein
MPNLAVIFSNLLINVFIFQKVVDSQNTISFLLEKLLTYLEKVLMDDVMQTLYYFKEHKRKHQLG